MSSAAAGRFLCFAYGSNMPSARIKSRCPSAVFHSLGRLEGWQLKWNFDCPDGSAKCSVEKAASKTVHGVIYDISLAEINTLRQAEGFAPERARSENVYFEEDIEVFSAGAPLRVKLYVANPDKCAEGLKPYDWYYAHVLIGAAEHKLPQDYIKDFIESVEVKPDADIKRRIKELASYALNSC